MVSGAFVSVAAPHQVSSSVALQGPGSQTCPRPAEQNSVRFRQAERRAARSCPVASIASPDFVPGAVLHLAEVSSVNYNSLAVTALVFFLTFWGSISFVKGSTKPRITQASFTIPTGPSAVAKTVTQYLTSRGFVPDADADPRPGVVTFLGNVKASSSVSTILALVSMSGLWAGSLILNVLLPDSLKSSSWGWISVLGLLVIPWYRSQAERVEKVLVLVEEEEPTGLSILYVKAHRDEIIAMETSLGWVRNDPDAENAQDDSKVSEGQKASV